MFYFKGISNEDMQVVAEEENFLSRAPLRIEEIITDGLSGSSFNILGYDNVVIPLKIYLLDKSKEDDVLAWLNGEGTLEYNGRITTAYFWDAISLVRASNIKTIETTFVRAPFWFDANDRYEKITKPYVINRGNTDAYPMIKLCGKSKEKVDISIGDIRFDYTFDDTGYVEIDCINKKEYAHGISKSKQISINFDYPILSTGRNKITVHSGKVDIYVKRKDCWL